MTTTALISSDGRRQAAYVVAVAVGAVAVAWLTSTGRGRLALAVVLLLPLLVGATRAPRATLLVLVGYLAVIGDVRRMLVPLFGSAGQDPLLLLVPGVVGLLFASLMASGRLRPDSRLSITATLLTIVMVLQIVNPAQGGLDVGLAGALFYLVPLLWYWLGKTYADERFARRVLAGVVAPFALLAAGLILWQTLFGLLPYQEAWVETSGYAALRLGDAVRPFGYFTSSAECARFLGIAVLASAAFAMTGRNRTGWTLVGVACAVGLFLVGSRGPIVMVSAALAVMWAVQGAQPWSWAPRLAVAVVVGGGALFGVLTTLSDATVFEGTVQSVVQHQTSGLLDPTNPETSTAGLHGEMMLDGFSQGFDHPLGTGLGSTTLAAGKFGGEGFSTEVDLSDMFVSLGPVGGVIYGILLVLVLAAAVRVWRRRRSGVALAILGVLVFAAGAWLRGGEYSIMAVLWLLIGAVDRWSVEDAAEPETPEPGPPGLSSAPTGPPTRAVAPGPRRRPAPGLQTTGSR